MTEASPVQASTDSQPKGGLYAWYVVGVLILAYTVSFIDRQILTLMVEPIRATLQISDLQLSLLHGLAFALFYTMLGIPIGRLVDQRRRTSIIAVGIVVWSCMTAVCGLARNFPQLFLARIGVGVGEAALSPGAYSMLSDYFPPRQLSNALSIYTGAAHVGNGIAMMAGGALIALVPATTLPVVGPMEPWQMIFIIVGLPGLLVALWVATLREPARTGMKTGLQPSFRAVFHYMAERRSAFFLVIVGYSLSGMMWNGAIAWLPTFFIRTFGWSAADVGFRYGLAVMLSGTLGVLVGGAICMRLRGREILDANIRIGLIALAIAAPSGVAGTFMPTPELALLMFTIFLFGCAMPWGGAAAALQEITPNQMRGQVSAVYLFSLNLFGLGLGPTVVAAFTDQLYRNDMAVGSSIATAILITAPISAILLWISRKPYRTALAAKDF